jgi:uncharacterized protein (TIGR02996 family)
MSDGDALLTSILLNPEEDTPRLVYADWLDENGEPERAEFVRVQIAHENWRSDTDALTQDGIKRRMALWCAETELFHGLPFDVLGNDKPLQGLRLTRDELANCELPSKGLVSRGFVSHVELPAAAFIEHAGAIFSRHPVTEVRLSDRHALATSEGWHWDRNDSSWDHERHGIPSELFAFLAVARKGRDERAEECRGFPYARVPHLVTGLRYLTPDRAATALARACVAYGRKLARANLGVKLGVD